MAAFTHCRFPVIAAQLLFLSIYCCVVASSFLLYRPASVRHNLVTHVAGNAPSSCSSTSRSSSNSRRSDGRKVSIVAPNCRRAQSPSSPTIAISMRPVPSTASPRMLSDDNNVGEQQPEGEDEILQQVGPDIIRKSSTTTHSNITTNSSDEGNSLLPKTFGGGRYLVQGVLGTGSTASTYRCTAICTPSATTPLSPPTPPPEHQAQQQREREESAIKERRAWGNSSALPSPWVVVRKCRCLGYEFLFSFEVRSSILFALSFFVRHNKSCMVPWVSRSVSAALSKQA